MKKLIILLLVLFALATYSKDLKINYSVYNTLSDSDKARYLNSLQSEGDFQSYLQRYPYGSLDIYLEKEFNPHASGKRIFVIIDKVYYENSDFTEKLDRYALDLAYQGFSSSIYVINRGNPTDLRNYIIANSSNLKGIVFIGDIAAAWYEHENDHNWNVHAEWVSDLYYGDLNGSYGDSDEDSIFDQFSGDIAPDIWVSRITPATVFNPAYDGITITIKNQLIQYLNITHQYFRGNLFYGTKAANFIGEDWDDDTSVLTRFQSAYGSNYDNWIDNNFTNSNYCINGLNNPNYEVIYLDTHSSTFDHFFNDAYLWSESIIAGYNWTIEDNSIYYRFNIEQILLGLGACSACNFTFQVPGERGRCSLSIAYLFSITGRTQTLYGMTKTAYMNDNNIFLDYLGKGYYAGEAFLKWYRDVYNDYLPYSSYHYKEYWMSYMGGSILLGNPLIKIKRSLPFFTPNTAPVLYVNGNTYSVQEGSELKIDLPTTDYDGDPVSYFLNTQVPNASISGNVFTWTPDYTQGGITYTISIIANDGYEEANNNLFITVQNVKVINK